MIHIGKRSTLRTLCGKSVKRRWWVEAAHVVVGHIGRLGVWHAQKPEGADCRACCKVANAAPTPR